LRPFDRGGNFDKRVYFAIIVVVHAIITLTRYYVRLVIIGGRGTSWILKVDQAVVVVVALVRALRDSRRARAEVAEGATGASVGEALGRETS
jgi:hypothetical protein